MSVAGLMLVIAGLYTYYSVLEASGTSRLNNPCYNANPLEHLDQRMVGYKLRPGEKPVSDANLTSRWYSFGNYILASPNTSECGTNVSWHRKGYLPLDYGLHTTEVCGGDNCALTKVSYVNRCPGGHFVFFLSSLAGDSEAYCVEDPAITSSNYSKDPCVNAKPLDHLNQRVVGYSSRPGEDPVSDRKLALGWYSIGKYVLASPNSSDCGTNVSWHRTDTLPEGPGLHDIEVYGGDNNATTKVVNVYRCGSNFVFFLKPLVGDGGAYCVEDTIAESHLNSPCNHASPLNQLNKRVVGYKLRPGEEPISDANLTVGWYSFGDYILASPNTSECGTNVSWHRKGYLPLDYGLHTTVVCGGDNCALTMVSYVNRCPGGHFVFFLRNLAGDAEAYCVEDPAITSSNYSKDPCDNAKPLDHLDQRVVGYSSQPREDPVSDRKLTLGWYSVGEYVLASPNSSDCGTNVSWHRTDTLPEGPGLHDIEVYGGDNNATTKVVNVYRCGSNFVFFLKPLAGDDGAYCVEDRPSEEDIATASQKKKAPLWIIGAVVGSVALLAGVLTPLVLLRIKKMKNQTRVEDNPEN